MNKNLLNTSFSYEPSSYGRRTIYFTITTVVLTVIAAIVGDIKDQITPEVTLADRANGFWSQEGVECEKKNNIEEKDKVTCVPSSKKGGFMFEIEKDGGFYVLDLTNYVGCSYNNMGRPTRASIPISLLDAKLSHISLANNYWQEPKGIQLVYPNKDIVWPNGLVEDSIKDLCGDGGVIMPVIFNIREMFRFPQPISGEQERT